MKTLFDNLSMKVSRMTTSTYSTSFSLGIYLIDERLRNAIYSIYGFVRLADEIVDSFEGYGRRTLLSKFRTETYEALYSGISLNPILNSFQHTVSTYNIDHDLIGTFLQSMEMDLEKIAYNREKYNRYILGSAEVVGLMCLHVFTEGDRQRFDLLSPYAMKLGAAFQKVNFLRDMKDDYQTLGRCYFPNVDMSCFDSISKQEIEQEIEKDFAMALVGIRQLPKTSRLGVYLAYIYYKCLFDKIRRLPADRVMTERIRINNGKKLSLMVNCLVQNKLNLV